MANWKRKLDLKDLWKETENMTLEERDENIKKKLGKETAKRIREMLKDEPATLEDIQDIVEEFEEADCTDAYDDAINQLYDWADYNHNCWVATVF